MAGEDSFKDPVLLVAITNIDQLLDMYPDRFEKMVPKNLATITYNIERETNLDKVARLFARKQEYPNPLKDPTRDELFILSLEGGSKTVWELDLEANGRQVLWEIDKAIIDMRRTGTDSNKIIMGDGTLAIQQIDLIPENTEEIMRLMGDKV